MTKRKKETEEVADPVEPIAVESAAYESSLRSNLDEIKDYDDVVGYILRNTTSASIDLKDPAKIIDYALLSSTAFDAAQELLELFELEDLKNVVVKGKDTKMLSMIVEENKVSVFMMQNGDTQKILRKMQAT